MKIPDWESLLQKLPAVVAIVVLMAAMFGLKLLRDPPSKPAQIQLSRATSYFTEPVLPDGYIDYAKALNQHREQGFDHAENAAVLLIEFAENYPSLAIEWVDVLEADVGRWFPNPDPEIFGHVGLKLQLEERLELASWNVENFPNVAAFLESNEAACRDLKRISEQKSLFLPLKAAANIADSSRSFDDCIFQGRTGDLSRIHDAIDFWSKATICTAMLKADSKPMDDVLEGLRTVLKMSDLIQQQPDLSYFLASISLRQDVAKTVAAMAENTADQETLDCLAEFVREMNETHVSSDACREAVLTSRCQEISKIMALHSGDERTQAWIFLSTNYRDINEATKKELHLRLNVNPMLQAVNTLYDKIDQILTNPDIRWQRQQVMLYPYSQNDGESSDEMMSRMSAVSDAVVQHPGNRGVVNQFIVQHVNFGSRYPWKIIPLVRMEAVCWDRFANIAVALQQFKSRSGSYPTILRDVADLLPVKLEDTFNDPFGTGDFEYLVKDEGRVFELSSAGRDGILDPTSKDGPYFESNFVQDNVFSKLPYPAAP